MRPAPEQIDRLPDQYFTSLLARVVAAGEDVIDVGRGNPDVPPPQHVLDALVESLDAPGVHGYPPFAGLRSAKEAIAARYASVYGVDCMIGCMLESSISVAAAVHVAVAKANAITKIDLDGPSLCAFNPVDGGVIFNESEISVTDAPGLGIREIRGLELLA